MKLYKNGKELLMGEVSYNSLYGLKLTNINGEPEFIKVRIVDNLDNWELYNGEIKILTETKIISKSKKRPFVLKTKEYLFFNGHKTDSVYYQKIGEIENGFMRTSYSVLMSHIKNHIKQRKLEYAQLIFKNKI